MTPALSEGSEMALDQGKMGQISSFSSDRTPGRQLAPQNAAVGFPQSPGISPLPGTQQPPHSIQIFQFLLVISGCVPNPLNHTTSKKKYIYKDKLSHSWKILATSRYWGQKEIINQIPALPKSSPESRIHRDLSCSHPTGTAWFGEV